MRPRLRLLPLTVADDTLTVSDNAMFEGVYKR